MWIKFLICKEAQNETLHFLKLPVLIHDKFIKGLQDYMEHLRGPLDGLVGPISENEDVI